MKDPIIQLIKVVIICLTLIACSFFLAISNRYKFVERKVAPDMYEYDVFDSWNGTSHLR